jgi:hypothetical protein
VSNFLQPRSTVRCLMFASLILLASTTPGSAGPSAKKLIEFGWDEPSTAFMRQHIAEMEKTPFDGCVFHADATDAHGKNHSFQWECWSKRSFTEAELRPALEDLKATKFHRFTSNFLRFDTAPADLDWFDDYSAIVNNAKVAATIAREGKCKGILFDTEQYNHPLFNYSKQRDARTRSWEQYAAQARRRGGEVMEAFQEGDPGITIFLTFAYSLPLHQAGGDPKKISKVSYGLLAPFMDGMVDAAKGEARIVDGDENSYGYKDASQFGKAYKEMSQDVLPIVADGKKYRRVFSFGFGIWMDNNWRKNGWDLQDPRKNYFTPDAFEKSVEAALRTSDEYLWIYTEQPHWWSDQGGPEKLPRAYQDALRHAASQ